MTKAVCGQAPCYGGIMNPSSLAKVPMYKMVPSSIPTPEVRPPLKRALPLDTRQCYTAVPWAKEVLWVFRRSFLIMPLLAKTAWRSEERRVGKVCRSRRTEQNVRKSEEAKHRKRRG